MKKKLLVVLFCLSVCLQPVQARDEAEKAGMIVGSVINITIGAWGFAQLSTYGYVSGAIFILRGIGGLLEAEEE